MANSSMTLGELAKFKLLRRAREMAKWLRALAALAEDLGSILSTHTMT